MCGGGGAVIPGWDAQAVFPHVQLLSQELTAQFRIAADCRIPRMGLELAFSG